MKALTNADKVKRVPGWEPLLLVGRVRIELTTNGLKVWCVVNDSAYLPLLPADTFNLFNDLSLTALLNRPSAAVLR